MSVNHSARSGGISNDILGRMKLVYCQPVFIGVGRFRIFGGARFRILGGPRFRILEGPRGAKFPAGT